MSRDNPFASLEQTQESSSYVERIFQYGPARVIERVSHSELGDDYEVLKDLLFVTPGGRKVSAHTIAGLDGLRIATEANDISGDESGFAFLYPDNVIVLPRLIHSPQRYNKNGTPKKGDHERSLWSYPGCWLALLHEIGHAQILATDPVRHERDAEYDRRMDAVYAAVKAGEIFVEVIPAPFVAYTIRAERDAWAWALRALRRYRRLGIDFEPELQSTRELEDYIHTKLATFIIRLLHMMGEDENLADYVTGVNKSNRGVASNLKYNNEYLFAGH